MNVAFSVVIPLYNKEKSVQKTARSVLDQTYGNFEIVVVNDGSTDNSLKVFENIKDERIQIINQTNKGVSSARNLGIKSAKYNWLVFLDADDLWCDNHLESLLDSIKEYPNEKVFATFYATNLKFNQNDTKKIIVDNFFKHPFGKYNLINSSCVCIKKSVFENIGLFNPHLTHGEDLDMWIRIMKKHKLVKLFKITSIYNLEAENRSMRNKVLFKNSFASTIKFNAILPIEEKQFYQSHIKIRIKSAIYNKDIVLFLKLVWKFHLNIFV